MADRVSSGVFQDVGLPTKRKRILKPSAVVPVPVYSSRVSSSLKLKPAASVILDNSSGGGADDSLWEGFSLAPPPELRKTPPLELSDSEDESQRVQSQPEQNRREDARGLSPPPPESPVHKQSRKAKRKLSEINRKLQAVGSILSPQDQRSGRRRAQPPVPDNDDVIMVDGSDSLREIPLKIRCRTDVHKVLVLPSTRLGDVLRELSVILQAPPPRLLLLKDDQELPPDATVGQLGLSITDIIECIVMTAEDQSSGSITVKLRSRDRDSSQEFSVHREAQLSSIFSQYLSRLPTGARQKVRFHFDGSMVEGSQTAAQLDLEDGDIIEVWT